jgi:NitT/TauT family transport system permease protein
LPNGLEASERSPLVPHLDHGLRDDPGFVITAASGSGSARCGKLPKLEQTLNPFIIATQVVPKVALVPLLVVWFGFGLAPKVIIAAVLAFFPIC